MRLLSFSTMLVSCALSAAAFAQSYTPKEVRFEGASEYTKTELLAASGLKSSGTVTVKQIEDGMQRLSDTGLFADMRYTVDARALTLILTPAPAKDLLPVTFGNFVWWGPGELLPLVEARVPMFRGRLPKNGTQMDAVKAALVALLAEKGVTASVESMGSGFSMSELPLMISNPQIRVGEITMEGSPASASVELDKVRRKTSDQDFEEKSTAAALKGAVEEIYRDDGYLDLTVSEPTRSAPRADGPGRFVVDMAAKVSGVMLYTVSSVELHGAKPVPDSELKKMIEVKAGDPAAIYPVRVTEHNLALPYRKEGFLDVDAKAAAIKDMSTHHVAYVFTVTPGIQYTVTSVKTSGFSDEQESQFQKSFHLAPNTPYGPAFSAALGPVARGSAFSGLTLRVGMEQNKQQHTVALTITTARAPARTR